MPVRGANEAKASIIAKLGKIASERVEEALTIIAFDVGGHADFYVPQDTGNLIGSRRIEIEKTATGWHATIRYQADYARLLHESNDWKPKSVPSPGKKTGAYNPNAKPDWLNLGADDAWPEAQTTFRKIVKL